MQSSSSLSSNTMPHEFFSTFQNAFSVFASKTGATSGDCSTVAQTLCVLRSSLSSRHYASNVQILAEKIQWRLNQCLRALDAQQNPQGLNTITQKLHQKITKLSEALKSGDLGYKPRVAGLAFLSKSQIAQKLSRLELTSVATRFFISNLAGFACAKKLVQGIRDGTYGPKFLQALLRKDSFMHKKDEVLRLLLVDGLFKEQDLSNVGWFQSVKSPDVLKQACIAFRKELVEKEQATENEVLYLLAFRKSQLPQNLAALLDQAVKQVNFADNDHDSFLQYLRPYYAPSDTYLQAVHKQYIAQNQTDNAWVIASLHTNVLANALKAELDKNPQEGMKKIVQYVHEPQACIQALTPLSCEKAKSLETLEAFTNTLHTTFSTASTQGQEVCQALISKIIVEYSSQQLATVQQVGPVYEKLLALMGRLSCTERADCFDKSLLGYTKSLIESDKAVLAPCTTFFTMYCHHYSDSAKPLFALQRLAFYEASLEKNRFDYDQFVALYAHLDLQNRLNLLHNVALTVTTMNTAADTVRILKFLATKVSKDEAQYLLHCVYTLFVFKDDISYNSSSLLQSMDPLAKYGADRRLELVVAFFTEVDGQCVFNKTSFLSLHQSLEFCSRMTLLQDLACKLSRKPKETALKHVQLLAACLEQPESSFFALNAYNYFLECSELAALSEKVLQLIVDPAVLGQVEYVRIALQKHRQKQIAVGIGQATATLRQMMQNLHVHGSEKRFI